MSNAKAAVEIAAYHALDDVILGATVYQDVPQDAPLDVVIIGDMKSTPLGAKEDPDRSVSLIIVSMVEAEERAPLLALQKQIEDALDGKKIQQGGFTLSFMFDDDDAQLGGDGATYVGTSAFTVLALSD